MFGGFSGFGMEIYIRWAEGSKRAVGGLFDIVERLSQLCREGEE